MFWIERYGCFKGDISVWVNIKPYNSVKTYFLLLKSGNAELIWPLMPVCGGIELFCKTSSDLISAVTPEAYDYLSGRVYASHTRYLLPPVTEVGLSFVSPS